MSRFRRIIAIFILALFTCQSIMAGVDEHADYSSAADVVNGLHMDHAYHASATGADPGKSFSPDLFDSDCCHAHGHCHLLAFTGQTASVSMNPSHGLAAIYINAYNSLTPNTLLRPPTHA